MASSGKQKFDKYFAGKTRVETYAKGQRGQAVCVFGKPLGPWVLGTIPNGHPITVLPAATFEGRYRIEYRDHRDCLAVGFISDANTGKPKGNGLLGMVLERITASDFIAEAQTTEYSGVKCYVFHDGETLLQTIKRNAELIKIDSHLLETIRGLPAVRWSDNALEQERKRLGVYLGELLIGYQALVGETGLAPWGKASRFLIPCDPSFCGVDSWIDDGETVWPVSSKFGHGAAASVFSNILPLAIKRGATGVLGELVAASKDAGVTAENLLNKTGSKDVLYHYGMRTVLKVNIGNPVSIFTAVKNGHHHPRLIDVTEAIRIHPFASDQIKAALPNSITSFFCRALAANMEACPETKEQFIDILCDKSYIQANLAVDRWLAGVIEFRFTESGDSFLRIIGNKSAISDITCKQGMVNYRLYQKDERYAIEQTAPHDPPVKYDQRAV